MRHYALYDHRWIEIHRPEPVPGLLLELQPHLVHSLSSNPVMHECDSSTLNSLYRQTSYRPRLGPAPIPFSAPLGSCHADTLLALANPNEKLTDRTVENQKP